MKKFSFSKYHALGNSFVVIDGRRRKLTKTTLSQLALNLCDKARGIGADGLVWLRASRKADIKMDIYNADGTWAEKSGNGLRIAAVHLASRSRRKSFTVETGAGVETVKVGRKLAGGYDVSCSLGRPEFETKQVPVRTRKRFLISEILNFGNVELPVTCLAVGNPHTVMLVNDFDFDWQTLGSEIEWSRPFPQGTNVEFVKVVNRKKLKLMDWERGAGATGSSGTGAAASVCAMVMLGLVDRECEVVFETGSLRIDWRPDGDEILLRGPVVKIAEGTFEYRGR